MAVRKKLGELLVEAGVVRDSDVRHALGQQKATGGGARIGELLIANLGVQRAAIARALATQFELPFVQLPNIDPRVAQTVPVQFQVEHRIVPFRLELDGKSERLHLALADPSKLDVVDELRFNLRKTLRVYVAAEDDIDHALAVLRGERIEELETIEGVVEDVEVERNASNMVGWLGEGDAEATPSHDIDLELTPSPELKTKPPAIAPAQPPRLPPDAGNDTRAPRAPAEVVRNAAADLLDDLLGDMEGKPAVAEPEAPPPPKRKPLGVVEGVAITRFAKRDEPKEKFEFSEQDLHVLDNLERMATGQESVLEGEKVRPERMVAALIRLLIRRGVIHELEFLEELARK